MKYLLLTISFFLITIMNTGCEKMCKDEYQKGYDEGKQIGKDIGYSDGFNKGEKQGFNNGYLKGKNDGYIKGFNNGNNIGYKEGTKKLVKDSIIPTFGFTILLLIVFIIIISFFKYFHVPVSEKINSIMDWFKNIYLYNFLKLKLNFFIHNQKKRVSTNAKIYSFELSKDIYKVTNKFELDNEIFFIQSRIEQYLIKRNFLFLNKTKNDYNKIIKDILSDNMKTLNEKNDLLKTIYFILMSEIVNEKEFYKLESLSNKTIREEIKKIILQRNKRNIINKIKNSVMQLYIFLEYLLILIIFIALSIFIYSL